MKCAHPVEHIVIEKTSNTIECKKCGASFCFSTLVIWIDENANTFRDFFSSLLNEVQLLKTCRADVGGAVAFSAALKHHEMEKESEDEIYRLAALAAKKIRALLSDPSGESTEDAAELANKLDRLIKRKNAS